MSAAVCGVTRPSSTTPLPNTFTSACRYGIASAWPSSAKAPWIALAACCALAQAGHSRLVSARGRGPPRNARGCGQLAPHRFAAFSDPDTPVVGQRLDQDEPAPANVERRRDLDQRQVHRVAVAYLHTHLAGRVHQQHHNRRTVMSVPQRVVRHGLHPGRVRLTRQPARPVMSPARSWHLSRPFHLFARATAPNLLVTAKRLKERHVTARPRADRIYDFWCSAASR